MKDIVITLDIGGTSMKGAIVEENGNILYKEVLMLMLIIQPKNIKKE